MSDILNKQIVRLKTQKKALRVKLDKSIKEAAYFKEIAENKEAEIEQLKVTPIVVTDSQMLLKNEDLTEQLKVQLEKNQDLSTFIDDLQEQPSDTQLQVKNDLLIQQLKDSYEKNMDLTTFNQDIEEQLFEMNNVTQASQDTQILEQIHQLLAMR